MKRNGKKSRTNKYFNVFPECSRYSYSELQLKTRIGSKNGVLHIFFTSLGINSNYCK